MYWPVVFRVVRRLGELYGASSRGACSGVVLRGGSLFITCYESSGTMPVALKAVACAYLVNTESLISL